MKEKSGENPNNIEANNSGEKEKDNSKIKIGREMTKSKKKTKRLKTKEVSELNEFVENDNLVIEKD